MITDINETIKQLLTKLGKIDQSEVDISFDPPDRAWSATISKPTVNFYLYDVHENNLLRTNEWVVDRGQNGIATKKKKASRIDLSYLVTVWTHDVADQHRLLWHVLQTLSRYSVLPDEALAGELAEQKYPLQTTTAQPDGMFKNPADFWSALDNQLKPAINYVVTVPLDLEMTLTAPIVTTKTIVAKAGDQEESLTSVSGMVRIAGNPDAVVPGARIVVKEKGRSTEADREGKYSFARLDPGKYTFQVVGPSGKTTEKPVVVPSPGYDLEL